MRLSLVSSCGRKLGVSSESQEKVDDVKAPGRVMGDGAGTWMGTLTGEVGRRYVVLGVLVNASWSTLYVRFVIVWI